jgi:hypothetical protein
MKSSPRIAEVAMWLIDHQMNMLINEFGQYFARLPLKKVKIVHGDALCRSLQVVS